MNITKEDLQRIIKEELEAVLEFEEKDNTQPTDPEEYRKWACRMANEPENRPPGISQPQMIAACKGEEVSEAKSYHWDEPDWFYGGGYGQGTLEEKKNQQKGKKRAAKVAKRKKAKKQASSEKNLGDWFDRQGEKGSKGGWVDCKAPDGDGGYSECAQGKRKKKPYCRPTPSACKSEPQKKE